MTGADAGIAELAIGRGAGVDTRLGEYVAGQWPALLRYATALCGNAAEAEELVQSAIVRVALRWSLVRDKDNPDAYVRRAIANGHTNVWRGIRRREVITADLPEPLAAGDGGPDAADVLTVRRVLATLPPRQRAVLVLRYLEDRSERETAELLGCSVGTVKSQTAKGLAKLRAVIGEDER